MDQKVYQRDLRLIGGLFFFFIILMVILQVVDSKFGVLNTIINS